jgi:hypothetical protein
MRVVRCRLLQGSGGAGAGPCTVQLRAGDVLRMLTPGIARSRLYSGHGPRPRILDQYVHMLM